ncbi:hypothetical protein HNV12_01005 [Methanococcoides sp. SA1]|nr:hypothetical protein [Methanococcoides sp. SA1]
MDKKKRLIWLMLIGLISGIYFGWTSGSASLWIRFLVGVVMGVLMSWLVSGFLK